MTERHVQEDVLVELALGQLSGPERSHVLGHVAGCPSCRRALDEVVAAVDLVLPATPPADPPAGLDEAVLTRTVGSVRASAHRTRPRWPLPVAAGLVGLLAGVGVTTAVTGEDEAPPAAQPPAATAPATPGGGAGPDPSRYPDRPEAASAAPLLTPGGEEVGTVRRSVLEGEPVLVMQVSGAPPGASYECRLVRGDGSTATAASWQVPADGEALWLVPGDPAATAVELVAPGQATWARADLG